MLIPLKISTLFVTELIKSILPFIASSVIFFISLPFPTNLAKSSNVSEVIIVLSISAISIFFFLGSFLFKVIILKSIFMFLNFEIKSIYWFEPKFTFNGNSAATLFQSTFSLLSV